MYFSEKASQPFITNNTLNPILWDSYQLRPEVRHKLLLIAKHFLETLSSKKIKLMDITISGSNAGFNYSDMSDIDLHLIADITNKSDIDYYDSKKNNYNFKYDIKIKNIPVEVYVQDSKQQHHSAGIYSILDDKWLSKPSKEIKEVSDKEIKSKARNYSSKINNALKSNNISIAKETFNDIKRLRQAGLEKGGELSIENLAYKLLRSRGQITKLVKYIDKLQSTELSLGEKMKIKDIMETYNVTKNDPSSGLELTAKDGTKIILPPEKLSAIKADPKDNNINNPKNFIMSTNLVDQPEVNKADTLPQIGDVINLPNDSFASENIKDELDKDLINPKINRKVGGDPGDDFINDIIDKKWERAALKPRKLKESDALYKMLIIAGLV